MMGVIVFALFLHDIKLERPIKILLAKLYCSSISLSNSSFKRKKPMPTRKIGTYDVAIELLSGFISFDGWSEEEGRRLVGRFSTETLPLNMLNIVSDIGNVVELIRDSDYGDLQITKGDELVIAVPVGNGKTNIFLSLFAIAEEA